ncbi:hypothetical protein [Polyangium aurulentum]|uniref:hypothetical protein n=1 Tax=Polyangium aurulentum TaxID=2567896 RepID=UPI0010AE81F4|nr:hypothetical protein [Polyangium aurulentum]UQA61413.1 hypothetical protein E8A73_013435 [Polyangium aurulentum]
MSEQRIADLFHVPSRFMRSAHLERDFGDPQALDCYIVTDPIRRALQRIADGLRPDSRQRAWRITGDYGTGKSSFGLLLAHLLAGEGSKLPPGLRRAVEWRSLKLPTPGLYPLLVTGAREGLASALARSIIAAIEGLGRGRTHATLGHIKQRLSKKDLADADLVRALSDFAAHLADLGTASGIVIILDELGKFLEFSAVQLEADVYLLQRLAEAAARSGESPLVVVGLLHQGFHAYAEQLPVAAQQEWQKVAGRFEEILFDQPLEHISTLAARTLNVQEAKLPPRIDSVAEKAMRQAIKLGWYGGATDEGELAAAAARLYPLHPLVLPPLVRFLRRFGQHERSLFSFLLSTEPFGLQDFADRHASPTEWYRLHNLYDYVRATFGHLLGGQSHRSQWLRISTVIDRASREDAFELQVLKTIGLLNLLDTDDLIASEEAVVAAMGPAGKGIEDRMAATIASLKRRHLLYNRGAAGGYCLWAHTSVNLEQAFQQAQRALGPVDRVSPLIGTHLDTRPLVARRHHIETGTLRHFKVRFVPVVELGKATAVADGQSDGLVLVPLCDTPSEREEALRFARTEGPALQANVLIAVPMPLANLAVAVQEARAWEWVLENTPELNHDPYAAEEAARQLSAARRTMRRQLDRFIGLHGPSTAPGLTWFRLGEETTIRNGRQLLDYLSHICDDVFAEAPRITSELVNRRALSSAAAKARMLLIGRILTSASQPMLGLDTAKAPPEKSIYLSILKHGGVHRHFGETHAITEPSEGHDPCNLRPAFARIRDMLENTPDGRVNVAAIFAALKEAPYGARDGLIPILFAVYIKAREHELAFYEDGGFTVRIGAPEFLRLVKAPETFEVQLARVAGVRAEVLDQLITLLDISVPPERKPVLLDIVTPLCTFAARLPDYAKKTGALSVTAKAVRNVLIDAREPVKLLFRDLPVACGVAPIPPNETVDDAAVQVFVSTLRSALDELRGAYQALQGRNGAVLFTALDVPSAAPSAREQLAARAKAVLVTVHEPQLKAFCLRLRDANLPYERWLESIASLVTAKPPARWVDVDERVYADEVTRLAERFRRVESLAADKNPGVFASALRVVVTRADGTECDRVVHVSQDDLQAVAEVEQRIRDLLPKSEHLRLVVTSRVLMDLAPEARANGAADAAHDAIPRAGVSFEHSEGSAQ